MGAEELLYYIIYQHKETISNEYTRLGEAREENERVRVSCRAVVETDGDVCDYGMCLYPACQ